ncbi:helix-turn-helix transcriptional regulator [Enterococcus caccae]|uniref:Uncharacterized protein n=1 Tax=Enterococcus caccae ATCC BAA-1240 TaxID=1158612 RepID=R3W696_9ENTE|nr:helix-turn-helix transcriptional regulator [Enterococcus caccae]EOL43216.1 hypothetical protein UC7_02545 [Enterococcus caccae ATCC BAA-1240]EOT68384.1 hypothetical protein I580_00767 [Enterococcus caccae ATCC BAA-1240]OJG26872.1 hypothetical protein RU98_GL003259 [Enterococcus caccae]
MEDTLTDATYLIMLALLKPQHGYAIMKEVNNLTNGQVSIGPVSMYTIKKSYKKTSLLHWKKVMNGKKHISLLIKDLRV